MILIAYMLTLAQNALYRSRSLVRLVRLRFQGIVQYPESHQDHLQQSLGLFRHHRRRPPLHSHLVRGQSLMMKCRCTPNVRQQRRRAWRHLSPFAQKHRLYRALAKSPQFLLSLPRTSASRTLAVRLASLKRL